MIATEHFPCHVHFIEYAWQKIWWKEVRLIRFCWAKWHLTHIIQYLHMLLQLWVSKCHFSFRFAAWSILKHNNYIDMTSVGFFKMSRDADFYLLVVLIASCPLCWLHALVMEGAVLSEVCMQILFCTKLSSWFSFPLSLHLSDKSVSS